jgi:hypothetical protein
LPLAALAVVGLRRRLGEPRESRMVAALAAAFPLYALWIGGDAWDHSLPLTANRFQAIALPLVALLAAAGLAELRPRLARLSGRPWMRGAAASLVAALALLAANVGGRPAAAVELIRQLAVTDPPLQCDATNHFVERLYAFRRRVPEPATVGVVWAGLTAFYSDYRLYDELGFNDRRIARQPPRVGRSFAEWRDFWPGHVKWDERLFLEEYRPDAFFQVWSQWGDGVEARLAAAGYRQEGPWWLREDFAAERERPRAAAHGSRGGPQPSRQARAR